MSTGISEALNPGSRAMVAADGADVPLRGGKDGSAVYGGGDAAPRPPVHGKGGKLGMWALVALIYFEVSGGPYGIEDAVRQTLRPAAAAAAAAAVGLRSSYRGPKGLCGLLADLRGRSRTVLCSDVVTNTAGGTS